MGEMAIRLRSRLAALLLAWAVAPLSVAEPLRAQELPPPAAVAALSKRLAAPPALGRSVNQLAQDCLMYLAAAPAEGSLARALTIARRIAELSDDNADGRKGWGVEASSEVKACAGPGSRQGLAPGSCNAAGTEYTYQTGLAITCLARAALASGDQLLLATAESAATDSWAMGRSDFPCPGCFTYWPSYNPNDHHRYIRNMNVAMGMGLAWLWRATGTSAYRDRARAVGAAEVWEVAQGNRGYLSAADPAFLERQSAESSRTENHLTLVAKGLYDIGRVLNDAKLVETSGRIIEHWLTCADKRCLVGSCRYWAGSTERCNTALTLASCPLRAASPAAGEHCLRATSRLTSWTNLALWYVLER